MRTTRRLIGFAALVLLTGAVAGCSDPDGFEEFERAVDDGATCAELFEIRNSWDPDSSDVVEANEVLREIGCHSSSSDRTDL